MHLKLLIDGIVRQTTVLIAQLSTASGVRAPLAHVADQVFLELAKEIEAQGVGRQVVADMFGLALRSYQKKMQRLTESASDRGHTLWEAVLAFVEKEGPTRKRVMARFEHDGEREVAAVLRDLVRSGLITTTGSGDGTIYGLTSEAARRQIQQRQDRDAVANRIWLSVFRREATTRTEVVAMLPGDPELVDEAIEDLLSTGRLSEVDGRLASANLVLPLGAEQGWETAILDHFRTVAVAIARKVRSGSSAARGADRTGGSTFTFTVAPGHPYETRVYALLSKIRADVQGLWDEVARHNQQHPPDAEQSVRVSFYLGQTLETEDDPSFPEPEEEVAP